MDLRAVDRKFTSVAHAGFELVLIFFVWNCAYWLTVFLMDPCFRTAQEEICGRADPPMLMRAFLVFLSPALIVLAYDLVQIRRGKLSSLLKWIRSAPAAVVVVLYPALLVWFRWGL